MKNLTIMKKSIILPLIMALVISMMPMTSFGATKFKAPKNTKLTSCKLTDSREVTLKWKKVKGVTGYKVYRKKSNTNLVYIGSVKGAANLTYVDTDLEKYDFGEIRYLVRTYKTKGKKTKLSDKRFTNRKTVNIKDMAWDPNTEPVNEEIYEAYKKAIDIPLSAKRDLMLYAINRERAKYWGDNNHSVQMLDALNETAQEKCEEMIRIHEYAHTLSTIGSFVNQLENRNFKHYTLSGENLAPDDSAGGAMSILMGSPKHRANILKNTYTHIGIGFYKGYCTQQFIEYSQEEVEIANYSWK